MNNRKQRLKLGESALWQRILERYKFRRRLLRGRVPLVFFRLWSPGESQQVRSSAPRNVFPYSLNLRLELSWPQWLVNPSRPSVSAVFNTAVIRELKTTWKNTAGANSTAGGESTTQRRQVSLPDFHSPDNARTLVQRSEDRRILNTERREISHARAAIITQEPVPSVDLQTPITQSPTEPLPPADKNISVPVILRPERRAFTPIVFRSSNSRQRIGRQIAGATSELKSKVALTRHFRDERLTRSLKTIAEQAASAVSSIPLSFTHHAPRGADEPGLLHAQRSRLYAQPVPIDFATQPTPDSTERVQPQQSSSQRLPASAPPAQPPLDIGRLSEEVYQHIQRKIRVERERRGR